MQFQRVISDIFAEMYLKVLQLVWNFLLASPTHLRPLLSSSDKYYGAKLYF